MANALSNKERALMDGYWRAANYLSVGQIYLYDNPLLKQTLTKEHIKPRLLGHWGTTPGLNFIYVHLNRVINKHNLDMIYITGPGHGGPGLVANAYLEGTYSEVYPNISPDEQGMKRLFTQFSIDRQRPPACAADAARTRRQRICACSLQSDAARERDLRAGRPRRQGRHRPRSYGVELRRVRGADAQANPRDGAGLAPLPGRMPGRRDTGAGGCPRGPGDRPVARARWRHNAVRAWTRAARVRGALDRPACRQWSTFSAEHGHAVRAWLLPQNTGNTNLERTSSQLARSEERLCAQALG